ncbi:MAG: FAD-dependent oxidoreductase [Pseudomonadota bacterium]
MSIDASKVNMNNTSQNEDSVVVVGAGPVGLAAAAHLTMRGMNPIVLEKGTHAGAAIQQWGHVRVFTPWHYVTDSAMVELLESSGWQHPQQESIPTGSEIVNAYLKPAATYFGDQVHYGVTVTAITKKGFSKSVSEGRNDVPYVVHYRTDDQREHVLEADVIIDATGTWSNPNPIGVNGVPVPGEQQFADKITYGIPDILDKDQASYLGRRILVLGGGHSAANVILDALKLKSEYPDTQLFCGLRSDNADRLVGGGINDDFPARGALGNAMKEALEAGDLEILAPAQVVRIDGTDTGMRVDVLVEGVERSVEVDRIIVTTGFRPDLDMLRELRLDLDDVVEAPRVLAPLIDPNLHSCGTVPAHGVDELSHDDENFFIVGMKAYGRAPTFLMKTGYEQVRSIADHLAGNYEAARRIELELLVTGVCSPSIRDASEAGTCTTGAATAACCD